MPTSWEYGAVAFLDILGFASLVENDAKVTSPQNLDRLMACLGEVRNTTPIRNLDLRSFSDSIVVAAPLTPTAVAELIESTVGLQRIFLKSAFLVRGGIALGKHFANSESVYSEALVRAYRLEVDRARFPRILLDSNLLDWFMNSDDCASELKLRFRQYLIRDRDDEIFIHYLSADLLDQHADLIDSYKLPEVTASVVEKLQWLAAYHNYFAGVMDQNRLINGPLVTGFQPF